MCRATDDLDTVLTVYVTLNKFCPSYYDISVLGLLDPIVANHIITI